MKKLLSLVTILLLLAGIVPGQSALAGSQTASKSMADSGFTPAEVEAWALGCSAILAENNRINPGSIHDPHLFGMLPDDYLGQVNAKDMLTGSWNSDSREKVIATIERMTDSGHNARFAESYALLSNLVLPELELMAKLNPDLDLNKMLLTKTIGDKWGDKQIKAWDWFRMTHLAGWAYIAGYLDREEAYEYMLPSIERLKATFSSWDEAVDNYMDGYAWWAGADVTDPGGEYQKRLDIYEKLKSDISLFNPTVWGDAFVPAVEQTDPAAADSDFEYQDNGNGTCIITKYKGSGKGKLIIPQTLDGLSVSAIGDFAFTGFMDFSGSLEIPEGVETIGSNAFWGLSGITSLTLPGSLRSMGESAFSFCSSLTDLTLTEGMTSIGPSAFYYCNNLSSVTFPESLTHIGGSAFELCSYLSSVRIPGSLSSTGGNPFPNCFSLLDITVSPDNEIFFAQDGVLFHKTEKTLVSYPADRSGSYTIPQDILTIGPSAFSGCSGLTNLTIPDGVTTIGSKAFESCYSLTGLTISDSVTSIGEEAFAWCMSLTDAKIPDSVTTIGNGAFSWCSGLKSITLPQGMTVINDNLLSQCPELAQVTIPQGVTSIGSYAFDGCSSLSSVILPDGLTSIGMYAFDGCSALARVSIPDSVTSIGDGAFYLCSGLTEVILPDSVTSIGYDAFYECSKVTLTVMQDSYAEEYAKKNGIAHALSI